MGLEGERGTGNSTAAETSLPVPPAAAPRPDHCCCPMPRWDGERGAPVNPPHRVPRASELPFPRPAPAGAQINLGAL